MRCKKTSEELLDYVELYNPRECNNQIYYDVMVILPDDYTITSKICDRNEYVVITLSKLGNIEINTKDFLYITVTI